MRPKYTQESYTWTKHNFMHFLLEAMYLGFVCLFVRFSFNEKSKQTYRQQEKMVAIADCIRNERNTESLRVVNSDV